MKHAGSVTAGEAQHSWPHNAGTAKPSPGPVPVYLFLWGVLILDIEDGWCFYSDRNVFHFTSCVFLNQGFSFTENPCPEGFLRQERVLVPSSNVHSVLSARAPFLNGHADGSVKAVCV